MSCRKNRGDVGMRHCRLLVAAVIVAFLVLIGISIGKAAKESTHTTSTPEAAAPKAEEPPRTLTAEEARELLPEVPETPLLHVLVNLKKGITREEATQAVLAVAERECSSKTCLTWEHPFVRESPFRHYVNGSFGPTEPITEYRWLYHRTTEEQGNGNHYWGSLTVIFCGEKLEEWWYRSWWEVRGKKADSLPDESGGFIGPLDLFSDHPK